MTSFAHVFSEIHLEWNSQTGPHKDLVERYIEVDFAEVTAKKAMTIKKNSTLMASLGDTSTVVVGGHLDPKQFEYR